MRGNKLYEKKRAPKGTGRAKTIPVQVSAELHGELSTIKGVYTKRLGRTVTFEQMLRRWIDRLSRIDPDVNKEYQVIRKTRLETEAGAASTAEAIVSGISERMQANGTSLPEEALKEQEEAKAALEEDRHAAASDVTVGDSPATAAEDVPQEGRKRRQDDYWFINPDGHKVKAVIKTVKGNLAFFPEGLSAWGYNYRTLMVQEHWKMVDERGNEVPFQVAQRILKEFDADQ